MLEFAAFTGLDAKRFNRLPPEMSALIKSTVAVGSMTLYCHACSGLLRDIIIARFFSASDAADAFFVAFKIPNFLRRLFAEGAFSLAFVPVLTEYRNNYTAAQTRDLIDRVAGTLGLILLLLSLAGVAASPVLVSIIAAGFIDQPVKFALTADMLRITFPYILLISMTAMAGGILNTLETLRGAGIHPGIAQPEYDWLCAVVESASRGADYRVSLGGANRRHHRNYCFNCPSSIARECCRDRNGAGGTQACKRSSN